MGVVNHLEAMYLAIAWHTVTSFGSLHLLSKSVCGWAAVLNGVMAAMAAKRVHIERTVEASQPSSELAIQLATTCVGTECIKIILSVFT